MTCRLVAQREWPTAQAIQSQNQAFGDGGYTTVDENDGALGAGIAVAATMQLFFSTQENLHVGTNRVHIVLNSSPQENANLRTYQGASGPEKSFNE